MYFFFFSSRRRHTRWPRDWSSDVCSSDLDGAPRPLLGLAVLQPGGGVLDRRQPRPAPARRLRGTLSRSSAYQLDREVDPLDLPLRLMEAPRQLRRRLELCRALCAALPTVELMAD